MIPPQALAIGGGLALIAGFFGGWTVRDWKSDADQLSAHKAARKHEEAARQWGLDQGTAFARFAEGNRQQAATDQRTIRETFREIQVPSDCAAPVAVLGVLQDAVRRANEAVTAGEPSAAVPASTRAPATADRP